MGSFESGNFGKVKAFVDVVAVCRAEHDEDDEEEERKESHVNGHEVNVKVEVVEYRRADACNVRWGVYMCCGGWDGCHGWYLVFL